MKLRICRFPYNRIRGKIKANTATSYSHPIFGLSTTFFGSIASKHEVDIPSTLVCNCSCKLSTSEDAISTIIINEKCPPRSWAWDAPTFPPLSVTIRVTSATIPGRSTPTVLITIHFLGWDVNLRVGDAVMNSQLTSCFSFGNECERMSDQVMHPRLKLSRNNSSGCRERIA
jgi:hypothetical protein